MAWALDEPLEENRVVAETRLRLAPRRLDRCVELVAVAHDAHPAPAAARGRLDHEREADLLGRSRRNDRDAGAGGDLLCGELVACGPDDIGGRADPGQPCADHCLGELGALGEEAVSGMESVRTGRARRANVLARVEVRLHRDGLRGSPCVERARVVWRSDGDRRDPEAVAGAEDARGDLAAVRYEELPDRHAAGRFSRNARRPSWPSAPDRRRAARSATSGAPGASPTRRLAARTASGPPARRFSTAWSTAVSRSAVTSWTRPIRSAVSASKRSPVRK